MVEMAIGFLGSYLARKAGGLVDRAGSDVDQAIDGKLGELYEFVKVRLLRLGKRGERSLQRLEERPDDEQPRSDALEDLDEALSGDTAAVAQLEELIAELKMLDPMGIRLTGSADADTVEAGGRNVGVDIAGTLQAGAEAQGTSRAKVVQGENVGVSYKPGHQS
jgi:hypothetical protein